MQRFFNRLFNLGVSQQIVLNIAVWAILLLDFKTVNLVDKVTCVTLGTIWATSGSGIATEHSVPVILVSYCATFASYHFTCGMDWLRRASRLSAMVPRFKPSRLFDILCIRQSCYCFQEMTNRTANATSTLTSDMRQHTRFDIGRETTDAPVETAEKAPNSSMSVTAIRINVRSFI